MSDKILKVGMAQISPIWLDKIGTIKKITDYIERAGDQKCELLVFGEALLPGYPFWLSFTGGAEFNSKIQKEIHAHYINNAIRIERGDLERITSAAADKKIAIYLGMIERASNRGGHSLYCSLAHISNDGVIRSVHRKLQPTYEERLAWAPGDGHGLQVHPLKEFTLGGLNCWENWMPLARTALYGQGENVHVAVWPGSEQNTIDISRHIAKESRSYVISVSGIMTKKDIPSDFPHYEEVIKKAPEVMANGGSCISAPDGEWVIEPQKGEGLFTADLDINKIFEERQNFDPSGHYSRPDVTRLFINRERQSILKDSPDE